MHRRNESPNVALRTVDSPKPNASSKTKDARNKTENFSF
jgi:hypothetical protein